jgi:hypothetical protein
MANLNGGLIVGTEGTGASTTLNGNLTVGTTATPATTQLNGNLAIGDGTTNYTLLLNNQSITTGGPYLPLTGGTLTGNLTFGNTGVISNASGVFQIQSFSGPKYTTLSMDSLGIMTLQGTREIDIISPLFIGTTSTPVNTTIYGALTCQDFTSTLETQANTTARIFNEEDGGGVEIINSSSGTTTFCGVNSDGTSVSGGDFVELYSKNTSSGVGSRAYITSAGIGLDADDSAPASITQCQFYL